MDPSSMFYAPSEMDSQQIRFSSSSEINTSGGVFAESLSINKRRACSNGFPNQLLLDTTVTQYSWAPVSNNIACSSGFGGSNTMAAMTSSFNSVNNTSLQFVDSQQQKLILSRSLESLALISAPSTSDSIFMTGGTDIINTVNEALQHRDDSRINYSFDYNDSGMFNGSSHSTTGTTNTESFSSAGDSFLSTQHSQIDDYELNVDDHHPQQFDSAFNEIIDSMQQCRPFQQDFEMDEC